MKYVIIGAVIIIGIFLYVLSTIPIGIEPLTELYFNNHENLPKTVEPNKLYKFSFTINNLEYKNMTYNYIVKGYNMTIDNNNVTLENNQSASIIEYFLMPENFTRTNITVTIKNNQSIHFWVEN
jgi:uncharacterized membrane protein